MADKRIEPIKEYDTPAYRPRKKRLGDRKEGRRIRTLPAMTQFTPFIMKTRNDCQNQFEDVIDITNVEKYLDIKHSEGFSDMTVLHVILAAYVRVVSERPGINRFVAGQRIFARKNVECTMTIKKEMALESPDTCIKVEFDPRDDIYNVYKKFRVQVQNAIKDDTDFDKTAGVLARMPRFLLRGAVSLLFWLDYHNLLPSALEKVSPFHGSMIITSMGSLGIPAIYHHLYNFGTLPIFISYGNIFTADAIKRDGTRERHHFITLKVVTDERVCDGYYYASAFKRLKKYMLHPELLDNSPETVTEDVD
ncbi:MAG: hypothetical protein E7617_02590 [Ruminococcaceae bacterium]|nr:hypothetical protein [Oscillospiraceae bacterium]